MKPSPYNILIVDDDPTNLEATQGLLEHWGYKVRTAGSGDEAIALLKSASEEFALILLDYRMPEKNGAQTAREIREFNQESVIAMYSCDDTQAAVVQSHRAGALDFIDKDDVGYLREAVEKSCLKFEEGRTLKPFIAADKAEKLIASANMIGCSQALAEVARQVHLFRDSRATLLITGESGSGKGHVARALHNGKGKFIAVNCAAYAKANNLLESELFGHEKGAFTGAVVRKVGLLEAAMGGTVFLDEIHHMSLDSQAQLLRAVDEKKIRRLGGNGEEYAIDFRLIVATKPDIQDRIAKGTFLEDLYFRLRFLRIQVPSLSDRPDDIPPLLAHFCQKFSQQTGKRKTLTMRAVKILQGHDWPGNVRDLEGYVENLLTICPADMIDSKHLDLQFFEANAGKASRMTYPEFKAKQEQERREFFLSALKRNKSAAQAAQRIGMPATTLRSILDKIGTEFSNP
ncbi:sigma-54 dependent transcriptional regulator [Bdellovibrionota bacterium FG-1]